MAAPEMRPSEIPDQEAGNEKKLDTPEAADETPRLDPEQESLEDIAREQRTIETLHDRAVEAADKARETNERIAEIRDLLGLPPQDVTSEAGRALADIEKRIGDKDKALDAKETEFLGVPEGESERLSASEQMLDFAEDAEQELEREQAAMERRQRIAEDFIARTDSWVEEKFGPFFRDAVNGKKAQQLMTLKIKAGVGFAAAKYVAEGGRETAKDLGFVAGLTVDKIEDENGDEHPYITEIDVEMGAEAVKRFLEAKEGQKSEKGELMDAKERQELLDAEKEGRVTREDQDKEK